MAPGVLPLGTVTTPAFLETTLAIAHPRLDPVRRRRLPRAVPVARPAWRDRRVRRGHPGDGRPPEPPELERIAEGVTRRSTSRRCCCGDRATRCSPRATCATCASGCRRRTCTGSRVRATSWSEDRDVAGGVLRWLDARGLGDGASPEPAPTPVDAPYRPLGAALAERCRRRRHRAGRAGRGRASRELARRSPRGPTSWPAAWRRYGIRPGDRVALLVPPGVDLTVDPVRVPAPGCRRGRRGRGPGRAGPHPRRARAPSRRS